MSVFMDFVNYNYFQHMIIVILIVISPQSK